MVRSLRLTGSLILAFCASGGIVSMPAAEVPSAQAVEFFEKQVRPLLVSRCYECHSTAKKVKGGLALDTREATLKGGEAGVVLVPGSPEKSKLIEAVRYQNQDLQMPPKSVMPAAEIKVLEEWVKMGAPDPREEKAGAVAAKTGRVIDINEGRKYWSYAPVSSPEVPKAPAGAHIKNPIDAFVQSKLAEKGLAPAEPADKASLIRRATFDLIGLPPTPSDVEAFVKDTAPDAFDRVIERLLATEQYGERWARHWLDVSRYADSNGMDENVALGNAWRYRDYVTNAFNDNKPYDRFVIEQIAGDLLPNNEVTTREEALTATGFLSMGAKVLAEPDMRKLEMDVIDEQIDVMGKAFLASTLGCARCHDHKFDPVLQSDYYALAAIFRSTKSLGDDRFGALKFWYEHSLATPAQLEAKKAHEKAVTDKRKEVTAFIAKTRLGMKTELQSHAADYLAAAAELNMDPDFSEVEKVAARYGLRPRYLLTCRQYLARHTEHSFFNRWRKLAAASKPKEVHSHYAKLFADAATALKTAKLSSPKATEPEEPALKEAHAALNDIAGFLAVPDKEADAFEPSVAEKIEAMNNDLMAMEDKTPDPPAIMGVADGAISKTLPIHVRGSYLTLGKEIERGFPEVMRASLTKPVLPAKQSGRLELARWLANSENPLTARVMVNRLWRWHFGQGIVASTDNFGMLGDKPSNPALLDWLARKFMENGWSIKDMHRLIMKSATYQQSSAVHYSMADGHSDPRLVDPENRLCWRANIQRLEAEEVRDALLSVSGWLSPQVGGKTIPLRNKEFVFNHTSKDHTSYESPRRAIYLPVIRNHLYDMLEQFDFPDPTMPTGSRNSTVIAPQALIMMNSPVAMESSERLAKKLGSVGDDRQRLKQVYQLLYGRAAQEHEIDHSIAFLNHLRTTEAPDRAWALLCQSLMAANEFMYLR
ncbi:MAG: Planctomycete cytochrome [Verrucomicrobiaceae bacterium]|nr:Planctomycete cytochrome [Verrucomicrobiaceae bacterium]